jgi:apoptosis-inducing factor 3
METKVGRIEELPDGRPQRFKVGERDVLVVRLGDEVRAFPAACPHYQGPLDKGVLHEGRLVCPWHLATYAARSGDLLEPPSFFALPSYDVRLAEGQVYVDIPDDAPAQRTPPMTTPDPDREQRTFVIVGAGAAAAAAAEAMRQAGFAGRIIMIGRDDRPPYDRPNCSKNLLAGTMSASWMPLRSDKFYEKWGIERRRAVVDEVDVTARRVVLQGGEELSADGLLIATGGVPRQLPAPGGDLPGVFTLRTWDDCEAIVEALAAVRRVVVVGASFIGLEAAASLRHRGLQVTVAAPEALPLVQVFGEEIGRSLRALHERNGVAFQLGRTVAVVEGDGRVASVQLDDGTLLPADMVIVGIGVTPATGMVRGVATQKDGSLLVDEQLRVIGADAVWAAGDIARFPAAHLGGEPMRIEHWRVALQHGRAAGTTMAGRAQPFTGVPFFWAQQYETRLGFVGYGRPWEELILAGEPAGGDFVAYYAAGGRVHAAAGTRDRQLAAFAELLRAGRVPAAEGLRAAPDTDLVGLLGGA